MFKKFLVLFFLMSMIAPVKMSWGDTYNFRYTNWGMTPEEVIASETMAPVEKNEKLIKYKTRILEMYCCTIYSFKINLSEQYTN